MKPTSLLALLIATLLLTSCGTYNTVVIAMNWKRTIPIEQFKTVQQEGWHYPPPDAREMRSERRLHGYNRIACGSEIVTTGTGKDRRMTTRTKYCDVPDYDDWYIYMVDRWTQVRIAEAKGDKAHDERIWPASATDFNECNSEKLGCERQGTRIEHLQVSLQYEDKSTVDVDVTESVWSKLDVGDRLQVETNLFGAIISLNTP